MANPSYSTALQTALNLAIDDLDWCARFIVALGGARTVVIKHDSGAASNATAAEVWASGTIVYSADLTGDMVASSGSITGFGYTSNESVNDAADLSVGAAVIRVTGEDTDYYFQGTLGLTGSPRTFALSASLDGTSGVGFAPGTTISAPSELPAGDPNAPYKVVYEDWSSGSAGATQTIYFDDPQTAVTFEDTEKNAELGAVPYMRSTQYFSVGSGGDTFRIGAHRFKLPAVCNDETDDPVYETLYPFGVGTNRWENYPAIDSYDAETDNTFLPAFKIIEYKADNTISHTFEMRDGLPINDDSLSQTRDATNAWRPHMHVGMCLYHSTHRLALSANAASYYAGTNSTAMRPKQARLNVCSNAVLVNFGSFQEQYNGFLQLMAMPQWAMNESSSTDALDPITDPYLDPPVSVGTPGDGSGRPTRAVGWDYEPGSMNGGHDWYPGPGGQRFNRFHVPSILAMYMTDPDGSRVQGNVPYRTMLHAYFKGFFNQFQHYFRDPQTLETIPKEEVMAGLWRYAYGFYNPQEVTTNLDKRIHTQTATNNSGVWPDADKNGNRHYHGANVDPQHAYEMAGYYYTHFNSVAAAISQMTRFFAIWMSATTNGTPGINPIEYYASPTTISYGYFLTREHAWRWLPLVFMWKQASTHSIFISRADIEALWQLELESVYDNVVVPTTTPAHEKYNSIELTCLRNLGMVGLDLKPTDGSIIHRFSATSDSKLLYLFGVMTFMKNTGCMAAMRAKSTKCNDAIDFVMECLHKYTVTQMLATQGRNQDGLVTLGPEVPLATPVTGADVPDDWYEWVSTRQPDDGSDLITNADGSVYLTGGGFQADRSQYQHLHIQAIYGFRDHFPELDLPGVDDACDMLDAFEATHIARQAAGTTYEFRYRFPAGGPIALAA